MNAKKAAAEKAVEYIKDGMIVGLGTGTTAYWAIQKIGERVKEGLKIKAVASSKSSEDLAAGAGIPSISFSEIEMIDMTIDGADEVDKDFNLIKGGGGALLREKILASNSKRFMVIVDESKLVQTLGAFPLPVEIVPFASSLTINRLKNLGCVPAIRLVKDQTFITDNGNWIADCHFGAIPEPEEMSNRIINIPGVVEHGLFRHPMVSAVIAGYNDGTARVLKALP